MQQVRPAPYARLNVHAKAQSKRIGIFFNPPLFFGIRLRSTDTHPVNSAANPDIFESVLHEYFRVDGEMFESGKKTLRIQKYMDTCGRGLRGLSLLHIVSNKTLSVCRR